MKTVIALFCLLLLNGCIQYGEGFRVAKIASIDQKGIFWRSYEINCRVSTRDVVDFYDYWGCSIDRTMPEVEQKKLADSFVKFLNDGAKMKVYFKMDLLPSPWRGGSKNFVYKVELMPWIKGETEYLDEQYEKESKERQKFYGNRGK